jgi:hypothetical protein
MQAVRALLLLLISHCFKLSREPKALFFSVLIQETKDSEGERILVSIARGAQDSNLVHANGGACFYKQNLLKIPSVQNFICR